MRIVALRAACALLALGLPAMAAAQDDADGGEEVVADSARTEIVPYIEAAQIFTQELEPFDDFVTYTSVAAGVDATIVGNHSAASASLRYERRIDWGDDGVGGDTISGVVRAGVQLTPGLTLEAGGLAAQTRVEANGAATVGGFAGDDDSTSQIYSVYAGPSFHTMEGDVELEGYYRFGYTALEEPDSVLIAPGAAPVDYFDDSTTHQAYARAGVRPNTMLPVGLGIGGGYNRQDISNLDQRIEDAHVRADITIPVSANLALVGGVGYEDVEVSSRDAVRDAAGIPVLGPDGRYVTDENAPRRIAYETEGLIWDAGVLWRPSRRTSLEAYVGERYGDLNFHGFFSYAPNERANLGVFVYDSITGFGGAMVDQLAGLSTNFDAFRNPITGEIGGCVAALEGNGCFASALGSLNSAVFRSRGIGASLSVDMGRTQFGAGAGYDRRTFMGAEGTVLENADGLVDETVWYAAYASTQIDERSSLVGNINMNWFESGFDRSSDVIGYSTSLAYYRDILDGLTGTAAVGLDGVSRENLPDFMSVSGLLGLRYSFY